MHVFELACFHHHNCKDCDLIVLHASYNLTVHIDAWNSVRRFILVSCDRACDLLCWTHYLELVK